MACKVGMQCYIDNKGIDLQNKTIPLILSDETSVLRFNFEDGLYDLILDHSEEAVDLSRKDILPIVLQHNTEMLPIGIYENVRLEEKKLKAIGRFDEEDEIAMKVFSKMSRGFMPTVSVGINIFEKVLISKEGSKKTYKATKWEITEASIVTVPANPNARVGLSMSEANPTASETVNVSDDNSNKINTGADMKFDREDLDSTEAQFKALVLNRDTLTRRNDSLELQLQTSQTALATKTEELQALEASMISKVSEAEDKFKEEATARLQEAMASDVTVKVALDMLNADTAEKASEIALAAKSNTEALRQGEHSPASKGAWDDFKGKA